jgi:hypothetical protein
MDFKSFLKDAHSYDAAFIVINRLYKQSVSLPCFKIIIIKDMVRLYINNICWFYGAPESIILDYGP